MQKVIFINKLRLDEVNNYLINGWKVKHFYVIPNSQNEECGVYVVIEKD